MNRSLLQRSDVGARGCHAHLQAPSTDRVMEDISEDELRELTRKAGKLADAIAKAAKDMPPDHARRLSRAMDSTFVNLVQALDVHRRSRRQPP
jgi:hypothetical protein